MSQLEFPTPIIPPLSTRADAVAPGGVASLWWFPPVVNDRAARTTAMLVVGLTVVTIATSLLEWGAVAVVLNVFLLIGFVLRVLAGPRFDPFGQLSVRWLAQVVLGDPVMTAGPPKRFAQGIGVVFSGVALVLRLAGVPVAADVILVMLVVAASLEGFAGYCLGCRIFAWLQDRGVINADIRADCAVR